MKYQTKSIVKRAVGLALGILGLFLVERFIYGFLDLILFSPGYYSVVQMQQITAFMRITVGAVYLWVAVLFSLFSDNSIDRIFSWMGDAEKRVIREIVDEETGAKK